MSPATRMRESEYEDVGLARGRGLAVRQQRHACATSPRYHPPGPVYRYDILEMVNGDGTAWGTYHWQTSWPKANCSYPSGHEHVYNSTHIPTWSSEFHEYAVEHGESY